MPEGDTLARTADVLRPYLVGREVIRADGRQPGRRIGLLVGATVTGVAAVGKNLLIRFDSGLELRTHLGMRGSWHRYRPGERWRRPAARARVVLEVPACVAVCFDAPTVELLEQRAEILHPVLARLGPNLLDPDADLAEAARRLRDPAGAGRPVAEALLDQRALAGIGNVYKSEVLYLEGISPFVPMRDLSEAEIDRLVARAQALLAANRGAVRRVTTTGPGGPASRLWVYGRAGRPCFRCGAVLRARRHGMPPRSTTWCPFCQGGSPAADAPSPGWPPELPPGAR